MVEAGKPDTVEPDSPPVRVADEVARADVVETADRVGALARMAELFEKALRLLR